MMMLALPRRTRSRGASFLWTSNSNTVMLLFWLLLAQAVAVVAFVPPMVVHSPRWTTRTTTIKTGRRRRRRDWGATEPLSLVSLAGATDNYTLQAMFHNMQTPASFFVASLVILGFKSPLSVSSKSIKVEKEEPRWQRFLRFTYMPAVVLSLTSHLLAILWATAAVHHLTDCRRHLVGTLLLHEKNASFVSLAWSAVNFHFIVGLGAFCYLIAVRGFFQAGAGRNGQAVVGLGMAAVSGLLRILNDHHHIGVATTSNGVVGLVVSYSKKIWLAWQSHPQQGLPHRVVPCATTTITTRLSYTVALVLAIISTVQAVYGAWIDSRPQNNNNNNKNEPCA